MSQKIEAPTLADVDRIARQLMHAGALLNDALHASLDGSRKDLALIQRILDSKTIEPEAEYTLRALGMAFGRVFIEHHSGYDWWMVEDEDGRDPAIRFENTWLLAFPETMILKRVEEGEAIDVRDLFEQLSREMRKLQRGT
jgi:hypothetical protein